ncbi:MAG: shikimate kinase I [Candidatus Muproteobacteria bacterium RBG_19FT_COMBO_61_10]|uniref:Shikimate kinase n=1 Tax=Candidatus Muproteobacteria bacterium RBG_19FT_COMBO_61_10 TaxID=1817761 RepID=A0A1F6UL91_9PROT|nr:MAG: shikimate kinase I [Candidatus Muproteobacteria bacterium RBG_19FT_COMBO_61_10]
MTAARSIFLIGPMGAGKSTIGRQLAALLKMDFLDTDHEIERRTGADIPLIFEIEGEAGFRRRESAVIDELTGKSNIVLATGGGAILSEDNRQALRTRGTVVYLRANIDILTERTRRDRNRPLLQTEDPRRKLEEIVRLREPLYLNTAHVIVDTDRRSPQAVARDVADNLKALWQNENPVA